MDGLLSARVHPEFHCTATHTFFGIILLVASGGGEGIGPDSKVYMGSRTKRKACAKAWRIISRSPWQISDAQTVS
jgi:hypothetical protein